MKKRPTPLDKEETLRQLSHAIFQLESTRGHLGWKVTELVRKSGFSRALVYKYLGSSREQMLNTILKLFLDEFYGLNAPLDEVDFADKIRHGRSRLMAVPEAVLFYLRWRSKESKLTGQFIEVELKFQKKLKKYFPHLTDLEVLAMHATMHGLVTSPFLTPDQAAEIYRKLFSASPELPDKVGLRHS